MCLEVSQKRSRIRGRSLHLAAVTNLGKEPVRRLCHLLDHREQFKRTEFKQVRSCEGNFHYRTELPVMLPL